ncbi:hypothetical protein Syun_007024 [Stephania yunnanensis]|uniref:Uncharacterized protein n=1 Tax=Stephania yunnanensis TaxID=152371 RepID=A0AAP0KZ66_9MAGN
MTTIPIGCCRHQLYQFDEPPNSNGAAKIRLQQRKEETNDDNPARDEGISSVYRVQGSNGRWWAGDNENEQTVRLMQVVSTGNGAEKLVVGKSEKNGP